MFQNYTNVLISNFDNGGKKFIEIDSKVPQVDMNGTRFNMNNKNNNLTEKTNEETDLDMDVRIFQSFNPNFEIISLG